MEERLYKVTVHYGTYEKTQDMRGEDAEHAIAKVWARLERQGYLTLGMAARSATATEMEEETDES